MIIKNFPLQLEGNLYTFKTPFLLIVNPKPKKSIKFAIRKVSYEYRNANENIDIDNNIYPIR